jgi:2,5-diamino-6-(ribosylamino)-4(3H)-pyrimidinone 5'-phosphate reductase
VARPRVTIHNLISVDGRLDGFAPDLGLYYELAGALPHQAILTGSGTMLAAAARERIDMSGEDAHSAPSVAGDSRPWLVIVDSSGRLSRLDWLRGQPYWRDVLVVCSPATPDAHLERLRRHGVEHIVAGTDRVDLTAALEALADRYGVAAVRVDAGGGLNGALLRAGLVDEISIVVAPYLVGAGTAGTGVPQPGRLVGAPDGSAHRLELRSVDSLRDDHVWLRYAVLPDSPCQRG